MTIMNIELDWIALNMLDVRKYIFLVGNSCDLLHKEIYANSGLEYLYKYRMFYKSNSNTYQIK